MAEVKRQLADEEGAQARNGVESLSDVSPAGFVITGLEIEEMQYVPRRFLFTWGTNSRFFRQVLRMDASKRNLTTTQATSLQERRTALLRKIQKFRDVQDVYMPGLRRLLDRTSTGEPEQDTRPETLNIHLPSSLPSADRAAACVPGVSEIEDRLRHAEACEALEDLRRQLRMRTFTTKFKARQVAGQGGYTRARTLQDQIEARIKAARTRYCAARTAVLSLRGPGPWEEVLQVLKPEDVRALNERTLTMEERDADDRARRLAGMAEEDADADANVAVRSIGVVEIGEGQRQLSWIWYRVTAAEVEQDGAGTLHEGIDLFNSTLNYSTNKLSRYSFRMGKVPCTS